MAVIAIGHKPDLTKDQAREIFARYFGDKYRVEDWKGPMKGLRDFAVIKGAFVGVSLKLDQGQGETKFVYTGYAPKWWARVLLGGLLSFVMTGGLTNEVRQFIDRAPEFH